jgi:hypothetical protein
VVTTVKGRRCVVRAGQEGEGEEANEATSAVAEGVDEEEEECQQQDPPSTPARRQLARL